MHDFDDQFSDEYSGTLDFWGRGTHVHYCDDQFANEFSAGLWWKREYQLLEGLPDSFSRYDFRKGFIWLTTISEEI
jgi:hypothetical protein